jgi:hypothetical protein
MLFATRVLPFAPVLLDPRNPGPIFQPARPLDPADVERVRKDIITRIRRVLGRYKLSPIALGLPPRPGEERAPEQHDSPEYSQLLLDFGEAQENSFLPCHGPGYQGHSQFGQAGPASPRGSVLGSAKQGHPGSPKAVAPS